MAGYSGTPLAQKLGIRGGFSVVLLDAPAGLERLLQGLPDDVEPIRALRGRAPVDIFLLFVTKRSKLETGFEKAAGRLSEQPGAGVWVCWPKKSSGVATDITEDTIREVCLP